jgi:hypothetical protein
MKSLGFGRYALCCCLTATVPAGCGGSQPPIGAGAMPRTSAAATHADRGGSWMRPEAKPHDLLYANVDGYLKGIHLSRRQARGNRRRPR